MSEQISQELLKIMNEIANNEATIAKIDASIFVRESERKVNEKVAYLYNMINIEAKNFNQRQDNYYEDINLIISHYKQKLNLVYDEFYCHYVNIQNEFQEASANKRIAMINYQKLVNEIENGENNKSNLELKESIKEKNDIYNRIIDMCQSKFLETQEKFEKMIDKYFEISSQSLQLISEQSVFQRIWNKLLNIFDGAKKYTAVLKDYHKSIDNIDAYQIVEQMRNDIVEFVANILELRGIDENELDENVRLGGRNG